MKIIKESKNPYYKVYEELSKIIPSKETVKVKGILFNLKSYRRNWDAHWSFCGCNFVVDLYRPELEKKFIDVCKKNNVDILYINDGNSEYSPLSIHKWNPSIGDE